MTAARTALATGTVFALAAGLMWGLVFVVPLLLPQYPALLLSPARYLAFGLIALPLAWIDRRALGALTRADWREALALSVVGNLLYYLFLAAAIQRAGAPLPTVIIGTLPVVIAVVANLRNRLQATGGAVREATLPWRRLAPSLALVAAGIALVNDAELGRLRAQTATDPSDYALGALLALAAVACWTWYPIRNAEWLRAHANRSPRTWATAQGVATLPLAALGFASFWLWQAAGAPGGTPTPMPFGPQPLRFVGLMFAVGLLASWLGTLCWNEASQRLPTTLSGQLIVFETLTALAYAFVLRGAAPNASTLVGAALLVAGVAWALRTPRAATATMPV